MRFKYLSTQILVVFVIIVMVVLVVSGTAMTILSQKVLADNIFREQRDIALHLSDYILFELEEVFKEIEGLSSDADIRSMDSQLLANALRVFKSEHPKVPAVYITDISGNQLARSDFEELINVSQSDGFTIASTGSAYFSDLSPLVASQDSLDGPDSLSPERWKNVTTLDIFYPVIDSGEVTGVIGATVTLQRLQELLENQTFSHLETIAVLARNGRIVAHSSWSEFDEVPVIPSAELINAIEQQSLMVPGDYSDEFNRNVKGLIQPIGNQDWYIVIQTPVSQINEELNGLWLLMGLIIIAGVAITVAVSWFVTNRLTDPLRQLVAATERVAAGDLDTKLEIPGTNEISVLANSFDQMVSELVYIQERNKTLISDLRKLNDTLEEKVEDRTRELKYEKDRADQANREKTDFISHLSHELRTLLTSIKGFSEMLQQEHYGRLNEQQNAPVTYITENTRQMLSLIDQIVDLEKIESGNITPSLALVQMDVFLRQIIDQVSELTGFKNIALEKNTDTGSPEGRIEIDESKMSQVMKNVLLNAVEYTPENGQIQVTIEQTDNLATIVIRDNGIGIDPDYHERIFDQFFRIENEINLRKPGLGLGLSISRRLVELHAGQIRVESEGTGNGSRFIISFPLRQR